MNRNLADDKSHSVGGKSVSPMIRDGQLFFIELSSIDPNFFDLLSQNEIPV
ncbi:hypothetical protein [Nosocomiicoccus sp. HMSC067E10]|uniref:hypothetical protein n=1 Tax=Nosocomiicoccus sp. HMSC067E10 TaxID=1739271 RepID=UPI00143A5F8C|nr:hypothetical protein [Nosocomiicoccus sp. HMSC067E10]